MVTDYFLRICSTTLTLEFLVRLKARELSSLLRDPERLAHERNKARDAGRVYYAGHDSMFLEDEQGQLEQKIAGSSFAVDQQKAHQGADLSAEEERQLRLALEISRREEEERQARLTAEKQQAQRAQLPVTRSISDVRTAPELTTFI